MTLDEAVEKCDSPTELCEVLGYDPYMVMDRIHNIDISLSVEDAIKLGIIEKEINGKS